MTDEHFEKAWGTTLMTEQEKVDDKKGQATGPTGTDTKGASAGPENENAPPATPQTNDGMGIVKDAEGKGLKVNMGDGKKRTQEDLDKEYRAEADSIRDTALANRELQRYPTRGDDPKMPQRAKDPAAPEKDEARIREEHETIRELDKRYRVGEREDVTAATERIGEKEVLEVPNYREHVTDDQMQGWGRALANFGSVGLKEGANAIDAATKALGEFRKLTRAFLSPNPMSAASQMLASTMVGMNTMYDTIDRAGEIAGIKQGADRSIVMETAKGAQYYKDKDRATQAANFMMQAFNDQIADTLGPDGDVTQLNPVQFKRIYEKMEEAWAPEIERIRKEHEAGVPPSLEDRAIMAGWDNISKQYVKNMRGGKATAREYSKEIGEHEKNLRDLDKDYKARMGEYNKQVKDLDKEYNAQMMDYNRQVRDLDKDYDKQIRGYHSAIAGIDKQEVADLNSLANAYFRDSKSLGKETELADLHQKGYDDAISRGDAVGALLRITLGPSVNNRLRDGNAVVRTLQTAQDQANANALSDNANFTDEQKAVWSRIAEYLGQRVQEVRNMSAEQRRQYARSLAGPRAIEGFKGTGRRGGQIDDDPLGFFDKTKKQRKAIRKMMGETYADKMVKEWWAGHALSEDQAQDPWSSKLYKGAENIIRQMARIERTVYKKGNKLTPEKRARALAIMEKHQDDLDTIEDLLWGYQQVDTSAIFPKSYLDQYQGMNRDEYLATLNRREREFPRVTGRTTDISNYNANSDDYEGAKKELETLRYDFLHGMYDDRWQRRRDAKLRGERLQRRIDGLRNILTTKKEEFDRQQAEREAKREETAKENQDRLAAASVDGLRAVLGDETAFLDYIKDNLHTQENFKNLYFADSGRARLMELASDMTPEERKIIADYLSRSRYSNIDALVDKLMEGYQPEEEIIPPEDEKEGGETELSPEEIIPPGGADTPPDEERGENEDYGVIERESSNDDTDYETELQEEADISWSKNPFYEVDYSDENISGFYKKLNDMDVEQLEQVIEWVDRKAPLENKRAQELKADAEGLIFEIENPAEPEDDDEEGYESDNLTETPIIDETENTETETTDTENTINDRNLISKDWETNLTEAINNGDESTLDQLISELEGRISVVNKNKKSKGKGKTITDLENLLADAKEKRKEMRKRMPERFKEQNEENFNAAYTEGPNGSGEGQIVRADNELDPAKFKEPGVDPRGADSKDLEKELEYSRILEREEEEKERKKKEELTKKTKIFEDAFGDKGVLFKNIGPKDVELDTDGKFKVDMNSIGPKLYDDLEKLNKAVANKIDKFSTSNKPMSREDATVLYNALKRKMEFVRTRFNLDETTHKGILSYLDLLDTNLDQLFRYAYATDYEGIGKDIPEGNRIYTKAEMKERADTERKIAEKKYLDELPGNIEDGFLNKFETISKENVKELNSEFKKWVAKEVRSFGKISDKKTLKSKMKSIIETKVPKGYYATIGKLTDDNPINIIQRTQSKSTPKNEKFQSGKKEQTSTENATKEPDKKKSDGKRVYSVEDLAKWYQDPTHVFTDDEISALKGKAEDVAMHIYDENKSDALIVREILNNIENLKKRGTVEKEEKNTDSTKKSATSSFRDMLSNRFNETHKGGYFVG